MRKKTPFLRYKNARGCCSLVEWSTSVNSAMNGCWLLSALMMLSGCRHGYCNRRSGAKWLWQTMQATTRLLSSSWTLRQTWSVRKKSPWWCLPLGFIDAPAQLPCLLWIVTMFLFNFDSLQFTGFSVDSGNNTKNAHSSPPNDFEFLNVQHLTICMQCLVDLNIARSVCRCAPQPLGNRRFTSGATWCSFLPPSHHQMSGWVTPLRYYGHSVTWSMYSRDAQSETGSVDGILDSSGSLIFVHTAEL